MRRAAYSDLICRFSAIYRESRRHTSNANCSTSISPAGRRISWNQLRRVVNAVNRRPRIGGLEIGNGWFRLVVSPSTALAVLFVVCITFFVFSILKSSDAYKTAVSRAKSDQHVVAALGTPIQEGMFTSGKSNVNGPSGDADLAIPISGPNGKATIYAVATKSAGEWTFSKLIVKVDGGKTIDHKRIGAIGRSI